MFTSQVGLYDPRMTFSSAERVLCQRNPRLDQLSDARALFKALDDNRRYEQKRRLEQILPAYLWPLEDAVDELSREWMDMPIKAHFVQGEYIDLPAWIVGRVVMYVGDGEVLDESGLPIEFAVSRVLKVGGLWCSVVREGEYIVVSSACRPPWF